MGLRKLYFFAILIGLFCVFNSCEKPYTGNHLVNETSPYLLQHAFNPVDWYPWGEEALNRAKEEDKLIVISVGFASCHWCHVMEEESFEDSLVSEIMNESFISIKVDKEERPDIDGIYMDACQLIRNKSCGWPLNVIALPDGRPVFAGTYYEKEQWVQILETYQYRMEEEREDLEDFANDLKRDIVRKDVIPDFSIDRPVKDSLLNLYVEELKSSIDTVHGGRQGGIKFPNPTNLEFLLSYAHLYEDKEAFDLIELTLEKMAYGGIYDQIGGGFSRYSTDRIWKVPHFEKMLYDNAQLISIYSKAYRSFKNEEFKRIVFETIEFCEQELSTPKGPYFSSIDADSDGEEGKFYLWKEEEVDALLSDDKMLNIFKSYYQIGTNGQWEYEQNVLFPQRSIEDYALEYNLGIVESKNALSEAKKIIKEARVLRNKPALDDKTLVSWNALMIDGLCEAYRSFGAPEHLERAKEVSEFILKNMKDEEGRLFRNYKGTTASINAFLDDYANLAKAFLNLYSVSFEEKWLGEAQKLVNYVDLHFGDEDSQIYYYTSDEDEALMTRKKEIMDGVIPSSNSTLARVISDLGVLQDNKEMKKQSMLMLQTIVNRPNFKEYISFNSNWGILYLEKLRKVYEVVVMGPDSKSNRSELMTMFAPNIYFMGSDAQSDLPLLQGKFVEGANYIYVCKSSMCKFPVETVDEAIVLLEKEFNQDINL